MTRFTVRAWSARRAPDALASRLTLLADALFTDALFTDALLPPNLVPRLGSAGVPALAGLPARAGMVHSAAAAGGGLGSRGALHSAGGSGPHGTDAFPSAGAGGRPAADGRGSIATEGATPDQHGAGDEADPGLWELVAAAQQGDGEAFGRIYDRYVDVVYRYIAYRVNDRGLAEDLTSETFLRALRRFGTVTYQGRDLAAFFITIARNLVFDHTKSARYRLEIVTDDRIEPDIEDNGTETQVLAALTNVRLLEAVRDLPAEQQECIVLRFMQGLNVAETAAVMGKNEGAVKAMQHRAVKRLHAVLGEELR